MYEDTYKLWLENVDEASKTELKALSQNEIKERFTAPLAFGTAGMRGIIGAGLSMMNNYTVGRATKGLAEYILSLGEAFCKRGVLISYDTRNKSFDFALQSARVLAAYGIKTYLFEDVRPVPVCSFAIRHYNCIAGVMITASHNPKEYNGYKVYGEDGAQMSPEATAEVVKFIDAINNPFDISLADVSTQDIKGKDNVNLNDFITVVGDSLDKQYFTAIEKLGLSADEVKKACNDIKIVYTPIHGSGYMPVTTILNKMNIPFSVVEEQKNPDINFSTVKVPNPEQPEALSLGIKLANSLGSDIVIGTDPDCDRMGAAIRDDKGEFMLLNGNQIGAMLMDYILMRNVEKGTLPKNAAVVKTIVTTRLADKIAANYGVTVFDVLTGFKFIGEKIKEWETSNEYTFMFGYEESFGYLSGTHARDKDAVVATMLFAEMACYYHTKGITLYNKLNQLFDKYGYFVEKNKAVEFKGLDGMAKMAAIMDGFRKNPPADFDGIAASSAADFISGEIKYADGRVEATNLPKTNVLKYELNNGSWVAIRPSGTEPKLKFYVSIAADSKKEANDKVDAILLQLSK